MRIFRFKKMNEFYKKLRFRRKWRFFIRIKQKIHFFYLILKDNINSKIKIMNRKHYYCIVASANNDIIAVTARQKEDEDSNLGVFHKLLKVDLNEHIDRKINHEMYVNSETICDLVNYMKEKHNDMKEIEFLQNCLIFFKKNRFIDAVKFTFYND